MHLPAGDEVRRVLRLATVALLALVVAAAAQAATPTNVRVAATLKTTMQRFYKAHGSDDVFTKVTCKLATGASVAHCKAYFTSQKYGVRGIFTVVASATTKSKQWQATAVTCTSLKTGKPVAC